LSAMPPKDTDTIMIDKDDPKIVSSQVHVSSSASNYREPDDDDRHSRIIFGGKSIRIRGRGIKNPYAQ